MRLKGETTPGGTLRGRGAWEPVLRGPARSRALETVRDIAVALRGCSPESISESTAGLMKTPICSLSVGLAGLALFFFYLARSEVGVASDHDEGHRLLDDARRALESEATGPGLYVGFSGVAWTIQHLVGVGALDLGGADPNEDIDALLVDLVSARPWRGHFDLVSGLVGIGIYGLARFPRDAARTILTTVAHQLSELATHMTHGVAWETGAHLMTRSQRALFPPGTYNLGMAHGTPGVVALLARMQRVGIADDVVPELLTAANTWLRHQQCAEPSHGVFPTRVSNGRLGPPARLGWCYGDLGIAAALLSAARAIHQEDLEDDALRLVDVCMQRSGSNTSTTGVLDACLCHGSAGVGHMFARVYHVTQNLEHRRVAELWYERALAFRQPGSGVAGFRFSYTAPTGHVQWLDDVTLLNGAAGIGLSLLSAASPIPPLWDSMMLLSDPSALNALTS